MLSDSCKLTIAGIPAQNRQEQRQYVGASEDEAKQV
jgi:hypothetical protein